MGKNPLQPALRYIAQHKSMLLSVLLILVAVRYQLALLMFMEAGDESEGLVAAKMLAAGGTLYLDIFNHHGPLSFLTGVALEKLGDFGIAVHRIPIMLLQIVAVVALYRSPLLYGSPMRTLYTALVVALVLLVYPNHFGHTNIYQVIAGLFLCIILSQYTLPSLLCPERVGRKRIALGNVMIAALPFLAILYLPAAGMLFVSSLCREWRVKAIIWAGAAIVANLLFLAAIGSFKGYVAYHLYLNMFVLPRYNASQAGMALIQTAFGHVLRHPLILAMLVCAALRMRGHETGIHWRSAGILLAVVSLLARDNLHFHGMAFYYSILSVGLLFVPRWLQNSRLLAKIAWVLLAFMVLKCSLILPADRKYLLDARIPASTDFSKFAKAFTAPGDRILSYSFGNYEYIASGRLPASGYYFYLPAQRAYNQNPKLGINIDPCRDIYMHRPKVMKIDKWTAWGKYPWESYAGCVQDMIDAYYIQFPGTPYYISREAMPVDHKLMVYAGDMVLKAGVETNLFRPASLYMLPEHVGTRKGLRRMGVILQADTQSPEDSIELTLRSDDQKIYTSRFKLMDVANNRYRYFELDGNHYTSGEFQSQGFDGLRTWQSHSALGYVFTCIHYEYIDGSQWFTPGCPLP